MESTLKFFLIRHGESEANRENLYNGQLHDVGLTEHGHAQMNEVAEMLFANPINTIYCSRLRRGIESAHHIEKVCSVPHIPTAALNEVHIGELDGKPAHNPDTRNAYDKVLEQWQNRDNEAGFPGGETYSDVITRFLGFVMKAQHNEDPNIFVIAHTLFIRTVIWALAANRPDLIEQTYVKNAHMAVITYDKEMNYWQLEAINLPVTDEIVSELVI